MKKDAERKLKMIGFRVREGNEADALIAQMVQDAHLRSGMSTSELCRECIRVSVKDVAEQKFKERERAAGAQGRSTVGSAIEPRAKEKKLSSTHGS